MLYSGAVRYAFVIHVAGKGRPGWPKMTWKNLRENDYHEWKLMTVDP